MFVVRGKCSELNTNFSLLESIGRDVIHLPDRLGIDGRDGCRIRENMPLPVGYLYRVHLASIS
jgi:hypothetical protein